MSKPNFDEGKYRFDLAFNLHFGAMNLLSTVFFQLKDIGVISPSEFQRVEKFFKFTTSVISRGQKKFYPEFFELNSSKNELSQS